MPSADPIQIITRRATTEARLGALLKQAKSGATVEEVKTLVYEKGSIFSFNVYVRMVLAQLTTPGRDVDIDTLYPVIEDAWNYFPHREFGGKCPAELFAELYDPK
jgi:hypothetical protein